jgi:hypothetical protein
MSDHALGLLSRASRHDNLDCVQVPALQCHKNNKDINTGPLLIDRIIVRSFIDQIDRCRAVDALCNSNAVDTLLSNFILPLQSDQISTVCDNKVRSTSCTH